MAYAKTRFVSTLKHTLTAGERVAPTYKVQFNYKMFIVLKIRFPNVSV